MINGSRGIRYKNNWQLGTISMKPLLRAKKQGIKRRDVWKINIYGSI